MSHLTFTSDEPERKNSSWYSRAVRIGDRIECAGQGGWIHETTGKVVEDPGEQIRQAFAYVERLLRRAGGSGWAQVYSVRSYHAPLDDDVYGEMCLNLSQYCPHQPLWTPLGVEQLRYPEEKVQLEVCAHVPTIRY